MVSPVQGEVETQSVSTEACFEDSGVCSSLCPLVKFRIITLRLSSVKRNAVLFRHESYAFLDQGL